MSEIENLWPSEIGQTKITTPNEILVRQAEFLSQATKNLLEATVTNPHGPSVTTRAGVPLIKLNFKIKASSIGYSFTLLSVEHGFDIYPVVIYDKLNEVDYTTNDEEGFKGTLSEIFNSPKVVNAINALVSQSMSSQSFDDIM